MVLRSHLATKAVRNMNCFVGFSSVAGSAGHCWEALNFAMDGILYDKEPSLDAIDQIVVSFPGLCGFSTL
jgi:hypothetical protein